jgi:signal recognition particle GTPase
MSVCRWIGESAFHSARDRRYAQTFRNTIRVTGLVITRRDRTAMGGVPVTQAEKYRIPVNIPVSTKKRRICATSERMNSLRASSGWKSEGDQGPNA